MNAQEILNNYSNHLSSKGKTRAHYLRFAKEFLDYAQGQYDRATVEGFLENMKQKHNYGEGSLNFAFRVVCTLFKRNKLDWPFNRGEAPLIRESSVQAPALPPPTIKTAIAMVRKQDLPNAQAFLALSTTYGLRRQEMVNLTLAARDGEPSPIRIKDRTIYIATLKHGRENTHIIPKEIVPYLENYDFSVPRSEFYMINLWYDIERLIGLEHIEHMGWHSIRRTLQNELELAGLNKDIIQAFMGHKLRTSTDMGARYTVTRYVGYLKGQEETANLDGMAFNIDQKIFEKDKEGNYMHHPFLSDWE
jgi:integrase